MKCPRCVQDSAQIYTLMAMPVWAHREPTHRCKVRQKIEALPEAIQPWWEGPVFLGELTPRCATGEKGRQRRAGTTDASMFLPFMAWRDIAGRQTTAVGFQ